MAIIEPTFQWFGMLFWRAQKSVQADSVTGLVSIVGFTMLYVSVSVTLLQKMFGLIHAIPASVLRWVGAHWNSAFDQGGQMAQELDSKSQGSFQKGQGAVSQGIGAVRQAKRDGRGGPTVPHKEDN
jgi:hypothetical protein